MFLHEYLAVFICLIAFLGPVRSNSSQDNDTCVQETEEGNCCQLPFVYNKKTYHSCTKDGSGLFWTGTLAYYWCYYDRNRKKYEKCKESIYHPPRSTPSTKPTISQSSSSLSVIMMTTSDLVPVIPHSSRISVSPPSLSTTIVSARSGTENRSSRITKQNMYIILACGIGGGILLAVIIVLTVILYFKRKRKMKVTKEEGENEQEMKSYRLTDESNNPVYESIDKDLDIQSNEEQALQPAHVYNELEDPQSPTSCTDDYSTPYDTSISNSDGPKITPALNDTGHFTHFNELYEAC